MPWFRNVGATLLLSLALVGANAQESKPMLQTTADWRLFEGMSAGIGNTAGSFAGVHNDAFIIAGGDDAEYRDDIRAATRSAERITWHDVGTKLPDGRAFGASASHRLGLFAAGGTNDAAASDEVLLLRWNEDSLSVDVLGLPPMPAALANGGAAIVNEVLYVHSGHALYAFDMSRIETNAVGEPLVDSGSVGISDKLDGLGDTVSPWTVMASLPQVDSGNSTYLDLAVVAQDSGRGERLYVIAGDDQTTALWEYNPGSGDGSSDWQRLGDVSIEGQTVDLDGGAAVALGQSHILLLTGPGDDGVRQALSYNTITGVWAAYDDAPPLPGDGPVTTHAVQWGGDVVVISGDIWRVDIKGPALSFGWVNMTVLVVYLLSMVMVGVYFVFQNSDTNDYFRGGQSIPWWAAACSIYATMLSSLTYVALPALVYRTDWLIYVGTMMILVVAPIAIYVAMPFFRQIDATSAYEYLSKRFNMPVRLFASGLFTLFHIGRMGIVLALTALALAAVTPLDPWQSVLVMGVLSLIYCTLGGVEAVIWTDTIQTFVLLLGAVLCFTIIMGGVDGGFAGFVDAGVADDKFKMANLDFGPGSITTLSLWVIVLGGIGQNISSYTADQAVVQRYMTTEDTRAAAKSIWANGLLAVPGALLFFGIGTGLYAFYQSQPEKLDPTIQIDQIFPSFIGAELPIGIAGLIVAGIFAAAQSTVSTSMNSIATTIVTDFMRPFDVCRSEKAYLNAARVLTFTMGVIGTLAGLLFISPEIRSLMEEYFKVIGMFMGALGGLFVLGVTTRRANGWGALVGIFSGVGVMVTVWLMKWADGYLFATIGILTCLLVGYLASWVAPVDRKDLAGLTLHTMRES